MPVLECCSSFKTLLLSTLTLCQRHPKVDLFPSLSLSKNIQTAIFLQNQKKTRNQKHKGTQHVNKTG
jgi:hypothetical protein